MDTNFNIWLKSTYIMRKCYYIYYAHIQFKMIRKIFDLRRYFYGHDNL